MEARTKVTKEVLCEESRFILANVMAEARYGRKNRYEDIRRVCEGAVSIPFSEYISFLEQTGYLRQERGGESLEVTPQGEKIVGGADMGELTSRAVNHFKNVRAVRRRKAELPPGSLGSSGVTASEGSDNATAGGEISDSSGLLDSRYQKIVAIGSGGIGTVYRAQQVPLGRDVALKEIRELFGFFNDRQRGEIVRRYTEVIRAAAGLAHPNILPIHDVNLDREFPYSVSELAPFGSARRLIADAERIPVALALTYLLQTLHALRAAHAANVIHRGLKPENLLIDGYGNLKVSDFGLSRVVERDGAAVRQVYVGMGNIAYMAPELYTDPGGAGPQADIYALGIIFYELITRELPGRRSPMPSEVTGGALPKGIDEVFDRMTRDSRTERYTNVDAILDDINKVEGLATVLDQSPQVLVAENPLDEITFHKDEPVEAAPEGQAGESETLDTAPAEELDESGKSKRKPSAPRPYSYRQRNQDKT